MAGIFKVGAFVLGLSMGGAALASDKQDFAACDGRAHPGKQSDGMRGEPSRPSYTLALPGRSLSGNISACDRALASPRLLPGQTLRRAHLLRARAAAHLQSGDAAKALADLDLAEAAAGAGARGDRFHKRSMGVSLDLLRAMAHAYEGDGARSAALARAAMAERPYSSQVQQLGTEILHVSGPQNGAGARVDWTPAMRLDPAAAALALLLEGQAGNFKEVLALRPSVTLDWPEKAPPAFMLLGGGSEGMKLMQALLVSYQTAYAHAATGGTAQAKAELDEIRSRIRALQPAETPGKVAAGPAAPNLAVLLEQGLSAKTKQVEARIAVAEGRYGDAIATLVGASLPKDAATVELLQALKSQAPAKDAALVPEASGFVGDGLAERRQVLARLSGRALITPETPRAVVDYEKSRPNILGAVVGGAFSLGTSLLGGIDRLDGFRSTANADGTTKVAFVGNTPSALLVQEMTLLRAAEVTRAAGKPAFVIVERNDYARSMRTTQGGVEISNVPTGFKSEMNIRFLDAVGQSPRALDALAVIDSLGPLYYGEKSSKP
ncbi:MAG TPA: hypothetical protein VGC35_04790 [Allosphingosinicella sp.]|jgi:hypothetical protein